MGLAGLAWILAFALGVPAVSTEGMQRTPLPSRLDIRDPVERARLAAAEEERDEALLAWLRALQVRDEPATRREVASLIGQDYPLLLGTQTTSRARMLPARSGVVLVVDCSRTLRGGRLVSRKEGKLAFSVLWPDCRPDILLALDPERRSLLVAGGQKVEVWDLEPVRRRWSRRRPKPMPAAVHFGQEAVLMEQDGTLTRLAARNGRTLHTIKLPGPFQDVRFSGDGRRVLASSGTTESKHYDTHQLWDVRSARPVGPGFNTACGEALTVLSTDGNLAVVRSESAVSVVDAATGKELAAPFEMSEVYLPALSSDGKWLAMGGHGGTARLWRLAPGVASGPVLRHGASVGAVSFVPAIAHGLLTAGDDGTVRLWDYSTGRAAGPLLSASDLGSSFANEDPLVSTETRTLWTHGSSRLLRVWELPSSPAPARCPALAAEVGASALSRDGRVVATARGWHWDLVGLYGGRPAVDEPLPYEAPVAQVWRVGESSPRAAVRHRGTVRTVALSSDGLMLATGSTDRAVVLWRSASAVQVGATRTLSSEVLSLAFSSDGSELFAGDAFGTVIALDTATMSLRRPVLRQDGEVLGLATSPDGRLLATATYGRGWWLWDVRQSRLIRHPDEHFRHHTFTTAAFSEDGRLVAFAGECSAQVVPVDPAASLAPPFETACGGRWIAFDPARAEIVLVTHRWLHRYTLEGDPLSSRWLPDQFAGSARFPEDCDGCIELALADPCLPLRMHRDWPDLRDVKPVSGEPEALLEDWTRRLTGEDSRGSD